jgi:hypothetical protein
MRLDQYNHQTHSNRSLGANRKRKSHLAGALRAARELAPKRRPEGDG